MDSLKDKSLFQQQCLIAGSWRNAASGASLPVTDPATQHVIGHVPDVSGHETREAIEAAHAAFAPWKAKTHAERAALLEAWHRLMLEHEEDLAMILTIEQGKPLAEAVGEIRYGASFVKWFAEEARRIGGTTIPSPTRDAGSWF
jgi:succinate-semialdehyde dehydrogenase/glutarate-semialdehyde dehydrogenase